MKVKQIIEKLQYNWPVKVGCFVIAFFFYVFYQISTLSSRTFSVPLEVIEENGLVVAEALPKDVKITLRGKSEALANLSQKDIRAYINLNYISEEGNYNQAVLVSLSDEANAIDPLEITIVPDNLNVKVEEQMTAPAQVKLLKTGKVSYGYEVKDIELEPKEVLVHGPKSLIENYDRLQTDLLNIDKLSETKVFPLSLINNGNQVSLVNKDEIINAKVVVAPITMNKEYARLKVNYSNVNPHLQITKKTSEMNVTLYGKLIDLEKYTPKANVVTVNCSSVKEPGTYELAVSYSFPHYYEFAQTPPKTVSVTFEEITRADAGEN